MCIRDSVRTAPAKGVSRFRMIVVHALRNALIPVITVIGLQVGLLLSGAILTETIFSWPGIGRLTVQAISNRDYYLVQGCIRSMADGTTFEERLFGFYYPMTAACDEERSYISALPPILELAKNGVTTSVDDHFTNRHKRSADGVVRAAMDAGIRLRMARLIINDPLTVPEDCRESADAGLKEVDRMLTEYREVPTVTNATGQIGIPYVRERELKPIWELTP